MKIIKKCNKEKFNFLTNNKLRMQLWPMAYSYESISSLLENLSYFGTMAIDTYFSAKQYINA